MHFMESPGDAVSIAIWTALGKSIRSSSTCYTLADAVPSTSATDAANIKSSTTLLMTLIP
ncbi:MAG: hypothetical protein DRN91_02745 [Candidatus Alkanophagales archaeon]|nr:MAG: hypothetical protein DRN91_02745 [Candidatus Alkanophagales archaeon]